MHKHNILYRVTQNPFSLYYYSPLSCQPFESITISCSMEIGVNNGKNTYEYTCLCLLIKRCSYKKIEAKCITYWKSHSNMFTNQRNGIKYIYISLFGFSPYMLYIPMPMPLPKCCFPFHLYEKRRVNTQNANT